MIDLSRSQTRVMAYNNSPSPVSRPPHIFNLDLPGFKTATLLSHNQPASFDLLGRYHHYILTKPGYGFCVSVSFPNLPDVKWRSRHLDFSVTDKAMTSITYMLDLHTCPGHENRLTYTLPTPLQRPLTGSKNLKSNLGNHHNKPFQGLTILSGTLTHKS